MGPAAVREALPDQSMRWDIGSRAVMSGGLFRPRRGPSGSERDLLGVVFVQDRADALQHPVARVVDLSGAEFAEPGVRHIGSDGDASPVAFPPFQPLSEVDVEVVHATTIAKSCYPV